jgi:hypothetical protein
LARNISKNPSGVYATYAIGPDLAHREARHPEQVVELAVVVREVSISVVHVQEERAVGCAPAQEQLNLRP